MYKLKKNFQFYFHFAMFFLIGCFYQSSIAQTNKSEAKPNIVFILVDDAGYDDFGFTGCPDWDTPNIDSLADQGVVFNNAYVTASVCGPSRAGLISGISQQRFGVEENLTGKTIEPIAEEEYGLPVEIPTIGTLLQKKGYTTAALGKWHLGEHENFHPNKRGFDYFYGFLGGSRGYWPLKGEPTTGPRTLLENDILRKTPEYLTDQLAKKGAAFIDENKDKPFFVYMAFNAVHSPMHAKESDVQKLDEQLSKKRKTLGAMTIALDDAVGTIIASLKQNEVYENTLIVFANDNGAATYLETNNAGLRGRKGTVWEGGIKIPFLLSWPNQINESTSNSSLISTLDIASTFGKAAGYTDADLKKLQLEGIDLLEVVQGKNRSTPLFWKRGNTAAVRFGKWKLINLNNTPTFLMNVVDDPLETKNYFDSEPEKAKELNGLLTDWKKQNPKPIWVKTSHMILADQILKYWQE